jgi:hypothetical protein
VSGVGGVGDVDGVGVSSMSCFTSRDDENQWGQRSDGQRLTQYARSSGVRLTVLAQ